MVARINTIAFQGVDVQSIDVQVQISNGLPCFTIVGLPDKAVAESRERVRAALHALGIALPAKRLTVNLAPADVVKEGSHYDLPIALGLLSAMGILPAGEMEKYVVLGELSLDANIRGVAGVLPAALHAGANDNSLICPESCGGEAAWAGDVEILAPSNLLQLINHVKGTQLLARPEPRMRPANDAKAAVRVPPDLAQVRGQESAKRALEVAAAGGHNLLFIGPPGAGKSMMASCLPGILPPLSPAEALEVSMIHSLAGTLPEDGLARERPFRDPHHSASLPALIGGGHKVRPGEISLAHRGVLFLDELPEFSRGALEALRQPLETGEAVIARANMHATYPARFQLVAAMNPCRCGYLGDPAAECSRAPKCAGEYQNKLSGPLLDRIDIQVEVGAVGLSAFGQGGAAAESSALVAARVLRARERQAARYEAAGAAQRGVLANAHAGNEMIDEASRMEESVQSYYLAAAEKLKLSARAYYRLLKVALTIADLDGADGIKKRHIAEALSYRRNK
ncbi:MAG: YifB family Mg chelatase-like AAA ATPase [Micavibrio sp.]